MVINGRPNETAIIVAAVDSGAVDHGGYCNSTAQFAFPLLLWLLRSPPGIVGKPLSAASFTPPHQQATKLITEPVSSNRLQ
ncbi:unnamed protein product [Enterobius vermicularis]|uniref:Peptidase_S8 domain-containing protein n=1 Tax=Enterobius vermicularis TaxID=51028 RepID=A0A0N4VN60_ENTVE|nr:unnamed protein product [Enterobius vermicularis]